MTEPFQQNSTEIPTQKVIAMRKQGLTDNQIIQTLQHEGFDSQNVLEALEMADMSKTGSEAGNGSIPQTPMENSPKSVAPQQMPPMQPLQNTPSLNMPPPMNGMPPPNNPAPQQQSGAGSNSNTDEDIEELIEAIIDEKWAEVEKDINRVVEWKDTVDEKIGSIQEDVKQLQKDFDDLHKAILGKIGDYDKNILNVGSQLKAMEEVFSKVLPTFTDNVSELSRISDKLKKVENKK